nr:nardilysin-like isoform X1 [Ipomoea batatas]
MLCLMCCISISYLRFSYVLNCLVTLFLELLVRGRLETPIWKAGKLYWLEADRQLKMFISFLWTLPSLRKDYLRKDEDSLAHLLGHEGKGSLLFFLKTKANIFYAAELVIKQQSKVGQLGYLLTKTYRTSSKISTYWRYCMIWELSAISIIRRNRGIQGSPRYARYDL